MTTTRYTLADIRRANADNGMHFFDRSSMRFFNSVILRTVYQGDGGIYFVSSEQFIPSSGIPDTRKYSVRRFNPETGDIHTCGKFNELTIDRAKSLARSLAKGDAPDTDAPDA